MEKQSLTKFVKKFNALNHGSLKASEHNCGTELLVQVYRFTDGTCVKDLIDCRIEISKEGGVEWVIKSGTISGTFSGEVVIIG
jgi:prenyltransferase beta subunit